MPEPTSNPPPKVTLEDLLRLKRHERPGPEFWTRFDQELRSRALRSFVHSDPSSAGWVRSLVARVAPWFTAGAAAALVLGLMVHGRIEQPVVFQPLPVRSVVVALPAPSLAVVAPASVVNEPLSASNISLSPMAGTPSSASSAVVESPMPSAPVAPTYAVAALSVASTASKFNKVPAKVSFSAENSDGVRYAVNTVDEAMSARVSGTAY